MPDLSLVLFGPPRLTGADAARSGQIAFRHRLALLALLSRASGHTMARSRLAGILWPETDEARARHRLNVAVHELRRLLGERTLRSEGDRLVLDTSQLSIDVVEFERALAAGELERAASIHSAPFLDGFSLPEASDFDHWIEAERALLSKTYCGALEQLGERTDRADDPLAPLLWHSRLVETDPYNTRYVLRYMLALERAGDAPNALLTAQRHQELLREIGAATDPVFGLVVARLRERPAGIDELPRLGGVEPSRTLPERPPPPPPVPTPRRILRPVMFAAVLGTFALGLAALAIGPWRGGGKTTERVLVTPLENRTGDPGLDELGWVVADWIGQGAVGSALPQVIDPFLAFGPARGSATGVTPPLVRETVRRSGASVVVLGAIYRVADSLRLELRVTEAASGKILATAERKARDASGLPDQLGGLRSAVLGALAARSGRRTDLVQAPEAPPPTYEAYLEFLVGSELFLTGRYQEAADRLLAAAARDSTFGGAKLLAATAMLLGARFAAADSIAQALEPKRAQLAPVDQLGLDWVEASLGGDRAGAYRAAQGAAELAPYSRWTVAYAEEAIRINRPSDALTALRRVEGEPAWLKEWPDYHRVLGRVLHLLGKYREELELVRRGRVQGADFIRQAIAEARALAGLGRVEEIQRLIEETLALSEQPNLTPGSLMQHAADELRAHGHREAAKAIWERAIAYYQEPAKDPVAPAVSLWALGNVLTAAGQVDSAEAAYRVLSRRPNVVRYRIHGFFGTLAARRGNRALARVFDDSLAVPAPQLVVWDRATRIYYRAQIAAQLGEKERAIALLQEMLALGWPLGLDSIHIAPELEPLRGHPAFDALVRLDDPHRLVAGPPRKP